MHFDGPADRHDFTTRKHALSPVLVGACKKACQTSDFHSSIPSPPPSQSPPSSQSPPPTTVTNNCAPQSSPPPLHLHAGLFKDVCLPSHPPLVLCFASLALDVSSLLSLSSSSWEVSVDQESCNSSLTDEDMAGSEIGSSAPLIPKPVGEAGRPERGGYNLYSALNIDKKAFTPIAVSICVIAR